MLVADEERERLAIKSPRLKIEINPQSERPRPERRRRVPQSPRARQSRAFRIPQDEPYPRRVLEHELFARQTKSLCRHEENRIERVQGILELVAHRLEHILERP